jgi:hypothetical protein
LASFFQLAATRQNSTELDTLRRVASIERSESAEIKCLALLHPATLEKVTSGMAPSAPQAHLVLAARLRFYHAHDTLGIQENGKEEDFR